MANIVGTQNERVFAIKKWLGLNEAPDGDTKLKMGEAAVMRNFKVTRDGNLQKRPGSYCKWVGPSGTLQGTWHGILGNKDYVLAVVDSKLYVAFDGTDWATTNTPVGTISTVLLSCLLFEFNGKVYIKGDFADSIYSYDGTTFATETIYIPLVAHTINPSGSQTTLLEQVNKLTPKRRVWLSPDGNTYTFQLPEKNLYSIISAKKTADGSSVTISSSSTTNGTVTFSSSDPALVAGTDTIEVLYSVAESEAFPNAFKKKMHVELYNGDQNNRIFLYGNSNEAFYTGLNYNGLPDPTYFPDLNVVAVGDSTENITSMIRYNSRLLCFKSNSTYTIQSGQQMLDDGSIIPAFYVTPVHRDLGGYDAQMIMNSPVVVFNRDIYSWAGNKYGTMTADERQAKRISDRVHATLSKWNVYSCYDDNYNQEYYISFIPNNGRTDEATLVWNYAQDVWYLYEGISVNNAFNIGGYVYYFTLGQVSGLSPNYPNASVQMLDPTCCYDEISTLDKKTIDCYWESGSMDFGAAYQRKYSAMLWVSMNPQNPTEIYVTVKTDRITSLTEKLVGYGFIDFGHINFGRWTFNTVHRPILKRLKIKAKKFVYYKLIFKTNTGDTTATVTAADIRVRFTGYAK